MMGSGALRGDAGIGGEDPRLRWLTLGALLKVN